MTRYLRVVLLAIAVVGLAACGSSGSSKSAATTPTSTTAPAGAPSGATGAVPGTATARGVRLFVACLRSHGVNLPTSGPGSANAGSPSQLPAAIRTSPKFKAALPICRPDLTKFGGADTTTTS